MEQTTSFKTSLSVFTETYRYLKKSREQQESILTLKKAWAQEILARLNVSVDIVGEISEERPLLFVGNHIGYLDIPLLLSMSPNISFVAKQEISTWPIFGEAAQAIDTIFVKRENKKSRNTAGLAIRTALKESKRVAIFPSGTTCLAELKPWRPGVFHIAHSEGIMIQPFRIKYSPLRALAYIGDDFFPSHLYKLANTRNKTAKIEFHEPVKVSDPIRDSRYWQNWTQGFFDWM